MRLPGFRLARLGWLPLVFGLLLTVQSASALTVVLEPSQDNSIYSGVSSNNSNALGVTLFTGLTGSNAAFAERRALLAFDIAGNIPAGATINSVQLDVNVHGAGSFSTLADPFDLFRLIETWGEGTSNPFTPFAGNGAGATVGDATWNARFYDPLTPTLWTTPGGTLAGGSSATADLPQAGGASWLSTSALVADVQDMLDNPGSDAGWAIIADPGNPPGSARRLSSREEPTTSLRPRLTVDFSAPGSAALEPSQDNSIYEGTASNNSNALGVTLFTGIAGGFGPTAERRALLAFDIAGNIPAGSTISTVRLDVNVHGAGTVANLVDPYDLFRLTETWGEGTSDPLTPFAGNGVLATPGDATWNARFYAPTLWTTPGGTLAGSPSATTNLPQLGAASWLSTAALVADVQDMLDNPGSDAGWAIVADPSNPPGSARRLSSREEPNPALRPILHVTFVPGSGGGPRGEVPDGDDIPSTPLILSKTVTTDVKLDWSASCRADDTDFAVYEGGIGSPFTSHQAVVCSTAGLLSHTLSPGFAGSYYLVVPHDGSDEGSYGDDSGDVERLQSSGPCYSQNIGSPVCP